ncbi:MAG: hypothetical protein BWK80_20520 [Desulfobacteraceae bacterium IS3]|nr:MAG: hypothetical protein BWK80_20520 [Desulfobacteraceae bacterium IS3]
MYRIDADSIAGIEFELNWESGYAKHTEIYYLRINFWRDILPGNMKQELMGKIVGDKIELDFAPGQGVPLYESKKELHLKRGQFNDSRIQPRSGRFYPGGLLRDVAGIYPQNIVPFRCVGLGADSLIADFNHPLASYGFHLTATVRDIMPKPYDRGGGSLLLTEQLTEGPGMQARHKGLPTDFFSSDAFLRENPEPDEQFYTKPRFVVHTDTRFIKEISALYGRFIRPGTAILDLMSSWRSHVPESAEFDSLVGLGMNQEEMADNPQLSDYLVHDVNQNPKLPFENQQFDLVICTVSAEYMTCPVEVFSDAARILRPGGYFVLTFSNRWFPPKVISLWTELHEFERIGLVTEYFLRSGYYEHIETLSSRGWSRPADDKYYAQMPFADPVYAVWGQLIS